MATSPEGIPKLIYVHQNESVTKSISTTKSCSSLMVPLDVLTLLTLTDVIGGLALAIFGTFLTFLL